MRIPKLNFALLLVTGLLVITSMSSCIIFLIMGPIIESKAGKKITVESGAIPEEYGKGDVTLLALMAGEKSYDKYLTKNLEKKYHGKVIRVTANDLTSKKYEDVKKFRYVFTFEMETHGQTAQDPSGHPVRRFFIIDRVDNKRYPATFTSGYFSRVMKGYLKNMEAQRLKNK